jgi:anaerobic selenocysteine-containing dehydrogenase
MLDAKDPGLRMAWVERGNPITQKPDTNRVLEAFRALEFRVVVDQFMTDTAREADIILPAKTMFEQTDVIGAYWHPYIQIKQKAIDPPEEVKPETEVYHLLAQRLGFTESDLRGKIPGPSDEEVEAYLGDRLAPFDGLSLATLRRGPILAPGNQEIAFSDFVFPTPSGKIELMSLEATERWGVERLPDFKEPVESTKSPGASKGYPLHFITPNTKNRIHSQFNNLKMIGQFGDRPEAHIHPVDATARGIGDGARVRIRNERGELIVHARMDNGIKRGCISVTNGWWITQGGSVNNCSLGRETDMGHGAAFHDNLVEIEPAR